ncbi:hypothetical protein BKA67DRAFT_541107 [Truncatella angustata]|uniref:Uncharacterized protein n=1 Tax=Truncatella angustata TaxID=152316 RepID=A0A9P8UCE6_9PEZI|nr:uncharacterized protein BKA67DRAFT_541107 [Truncatella angustata]KAH6646115.1 hypothetical protein BKA67DRAFT_541107 [Truncatella angustata]
MEDTLDLEMGFLSDLEGHMNKYSLFPRRSYCQPYGTISTMLLANEIQCQTRNLTLGSSIDKNVQDYSNHLVDTQWIAQLCWFAVRITYVISQNSKTCLLPRALFYSTTTPTTFVPGLSKVLLNKISTLNVNRPLNESTKIYILSHRTQDHARTLTMGWCPYHQQYLEKRRQYRRRDLTIQVQQGYKSYQDRDFEVGREDAGNELELDVIWEDVT